MMFVAAAEAQSFSSAAKALGVSQPTLSRTIRDIEYALGCTLFVRTSRGACLSDLGERFLDKGRTLLAAHAAAHSALADWRATQRGNIKVIGNSIVMPAILPVLMHKLKEGFGSPSMEVEEGCNAEARSCILEGKASLGVVTDIDEDSELDRWLAITAQLGILASPGLRLPDQLKSLDELDGLPTLRYSNASPIDVLLRRNRIPFNSYFKSSLQVKCALSSLELVKNGEAIAVCSGIAASNVRASGLQFIPLPGLLPIGRVFVVARRNGPVDCAQEKLREILLSSIRQTPWHPSVHAGRSISIDGLGSAFP